MKYTYGNNIMKDIMYMREIQRCKHEQYYKLNNNNNEENDKHMNLIYF